jgi:hypothetical protein
MCMRGGVGSQFHPLGDRVRGRELLISVYLEVDSGGTGVCVCVCVCGGGWRVASQRPSPTLAGPLASLHAHSAKILKVF